MTDAASAPEYEGQCAFALSTGKLGVEGSPQNALSEGAKTYYFSNPVAKILWKVLPNRDVKADETWSSR